ncbi:hypothetical protein KCU87_g192, partial [Aureobasidium melanogenum]
MQQGSAEQDGQAPASREIVQCSLAKVLYHEGDGTALDGHKAVLFSGEEEHGGAGQGDRYSGRHNPAEGREQASTILVQLTVHQGVDDYGVVVFVFVDVFWDHGEGGEDGADALGVASELFLGARRHAQRGGQGLVCAVLIEMAENGVCRVDLVSEAIVCG